MHIPALRTTRFTLTLRELTIGEALSLAAMPTGAHEASITALLRAATADAKGLADPELWTVQERLLATCQYLAAVADDGPDFAVGPGRYSDYLMAERDYPCDTVDAAEVGGDHWRVGHLLGAHAGAIERTAGEIPVLNPRAHWLIGRMAAQLHCDSAPALDTEGDTDAALVARMRVLCDYPESVFVRLQVAFWAALPALDHLFLIDADDTGMIALPKEAAATLPPVRFPARTGITSVAEQLGGQPAGSGT
jgi:hypothetical protein